MAVGLGRGVTFIVDVKLVQLILCALDHKISI